VNLHYRDSSLIFFSVLTQNKKKKTYIYI